jgi:hypothetical protein
MKNAHCACNLQLRAGFGFQTPCRHFRSNICRRESSGFPGRNIETSGTVN